jgi:hypothetical protein
VCVKKNRSAETMLFIVGTGTPASRCSTWKRRRSSAVAVSGERAETWRGDAYSATAARAWIVNRLACGEVRGDKFKPALHEPRDHLNISRKPVKPRNDKHGPSDAAEAQGLGELWPAILPTTQGALRIWFGKSPITRSLKPAIRAFIPS